MVLVSFLPMANFYKHIENNIHYARSDDLGTIACYATDDANCDCYCRGRYTHDYRSVGKAYASG